MSHKLIIGNWKMNPVTLKDAKQTYLAIKKASARFSRAKILICPPSIYLTELQKLSVTGKVDLGAQDISMADLGAHTGSISAYMVRDAKIKTTIIGHSERRQAGDSNEIINQKIKMALTAGLRIILCIGETVRDKNGEYLDVLQKQLESALAGFSAKQANRLIIAYEPVWAIGKLATGVETPETFLYNKIFIRKISSRIIGKRKALNLPVLYGGSITTENALSFLTVGQADGLLVGRASLTPKDFIEIVKIANGVR